MNNYALLGKGIGWGLLGAASIASFAHLLMTAASTGSFAAGIGCLLPFVFACASVHGLNHLGSSR